MSEFNNGDVTDALDSYFIDYAIDDDDDETNIQELMQQRYDMNKAVNEWYAKAKAWDSGREAAHDHLQHLLHNTDTSKIKFGFVDGMYCTLDILEEVYEKELEKNGLQRRY